MEPSPYDLLSRAETAPSGAWRDALEAFEADLRRRAVAPRTIRAYMADARQLAGWASRYELHPASIDVRALRRFAATLSGEGSAPSTVARKLAALRACLRVQVERGARAENPAELLGSPKRAHRLPRVLKVAEVEALLARIPALSPLELRD